MDKGIFQKNTDMGFVTNGLKVAALFAGKRKYKIMIVGAQLAYMGTKYLLERKHKKNQNQR